MPYFQHPDDIEAPRFGGWADNFRTYEDACEYYGADSPAQLAAEAKSIHEDQLIEAQDDIEIRGPKFNDFRSAEDQDIPW